MALGAWRLGPPRRRLAHPGRVASGSVFALCVAQTAASVGSASPLATPSANGRGPRCSSRPPGRSPSRSRRGSTRSTRPARRPRGADRGPGDRQPEPLLADPRRRGVPRCRADPAQARWCRTPASSSRTARRCGCRRGSAVGALGHGARLPGRGRPGRVRLESEPRGRVHPGTSLLRLDGPVRPLRGSDRRLSPVGDGRAGVALAPCCSWPRDRASQLCSARACSWRCRSSRSPSSTCSSAALSHCGGPAHRRCHRVRRHRCRGRGEAVHQLHGRQSRSDKSLVSYLVDDAPRELVSAYANNYADGTRLVAVARLTVPRFGDFERGRLLVRYALQPIPRSLRPATDAGSAALRTGAVSRRGQRARRAAAGVGLHPGRHRRVVLAFLLLVRWSQSWTGHCYGSTRAASQGWFSWRCRSWSPSRCTCVSSEAGGFALALIEVLGLDRGRVDRRRGLGRLRGRLALPVSPQPAGRIEQVGEVRPRASLFRRRVAGEASSSPTMPDAALSSEKPENAKPH